jgi:RNA polymerase-interacting CarD/CdnL/TRCF family regulator/KaiC/GvpD/RAD55 family RecA-like ATPase
MSKAKQASFEVGAMVTYGSHGIGTVEAYVRETVLDQDLYLYRLRFGNGKVIKVPETVAKRDFKPLVVASQIDAVIAILKQPPIKTQRAWHRKEKSYALVLGTQDATALAKLVRDLHPRDTSPSYTGLILYQNGLYQLVQLLTVTEGVDDVTILKRLNAETELVFRFEDAQPISYGANARSVKPKPAVSEYQYEAVAPVRPPVLRQTRLVESKPVVVQKPRATPLPKVRARTFVAPKEESPSPKRTKATSSVVANRAVKHEPVVQVSPQVNVAAVVAQSTQALEAKNQSLQDTIKQLRETIRQLQGENKNLQFTSASASSLDAQLTTARLTITTLRSQLTEMEQQKNTVTRERQRIDREQSSREDFQVARIKELGEVLGALFLLSYMLVGTLQEKKSDPVIVTVPTDTVEVGTAELAAMLAKAEETVRALTRERGILRSQVTRLKKGRKAPSTDQVSRKEIKRQIALVRVELFQYIFERTSAVERLEAYIKEQADWPKR